MSDVTLLGVSLQARARSLDASWRALARGLRDELEPLFTREFPVPGQKAMLTRVGGRCPRDGTVLRFDPWSPHEHMCPQCGVVYRGDAHDRWWAMGAQLWSAERMLHAAVLGVMHDDSTLRALAARGLTLVREAWPSYPNVDNALGPTRPFFSTYLESVWLLTVSLAARCLVPYAEHVALLDQLRDVVIAPSRAIIASFPEGRSNRQAWHVAARLVASQLLDDRAHAHDAVHGVDGLLALLRDGLLDDGAWYEGENYHLFAHRGLWFGVMACADELPSPLIARFDRGFRAPWLGVLPDGTFPSRRDARYAVSVHQARFAEWCELGLARSPDAVVHAWLHRLYTSTHARGETGRWRATGEIERDEAPCALSRADLGWKSLLFARNTPWPAPSSLAEPSVRLAAQGLAVLRRDAGRLYVALEGGHPGGGHGHPDRLALTLQDGTRRLLEDPGTGSYVERTLHWYRSTLAHNAPLIDGASQQRVPTVVRTFESLPVGGIVQADAHEVAPGVAIRRTVVLFDDHVIDWCTWRASREVQVELPLHLEASVQEPLRWHDAPARGAGGLEDGFEFLRGTQMARVALGPEEATSWLTLTTAARHDPSVVVWMRAQSQGASAVQLWRGTAPGPPGRAPRRVHWWRASGRTGELLHLWSLRGGVTQVERAGDVLRVRTRDGVLHEHVPSDDAWRVDLRVADARSSVHFAAVPVRIGDADIGCTAPAPERPTVSHRTPHITLAAPESTWRTTLAAPHYRRSEQTWEEAGHPTAELSLTLTDRRALVVLVHARTGGVVVPPADAENPLDNERAEVNADGVQLHLGAPGEPRWRAAWLLVPEPGAIAPRVIGLEPGTPALRAAAWHPTHEGYTLRVEVPAALLDTLAGPDGTVALDLLVNERPPERQRRRGQLVLSGAEGAFVYLRGDRQDPGRAWRVAGPWRADSRREPVDPPTSFPA
mgnify:CR=1 FL=1